MMKLAALPVHAALGALFAGVACAATPPQGAATWDTLGLQPAAQPVRERAGWKKPALILVSPNLHEELPLLKDAVPGVKLIEMSSATPRDIAAADATLGVCSSEVHEAGPRLQWIQWLAAGRGLRATTAAARTSPVAHQHAAPPPPRAWPST
jgi:hypothetical protein